MAEFLIAKIEVDAIHLQTAFSVYDPRIDNESA